MKTKMFREDKTVSKLEIGCVTAVSNRRNIQMPSDECFRPDVMNRFLIEDCDNDGNFDLRKENVRSDPDCKYLADGMGYKGRVKEVHYYIRENDSETIELTLSYKEFVEVGRPLVIKRKS